MAPSMRLNAIKRPPASHTATLTLMFISRALFTASCTMRLASTSVRAMGVTSAMSEFLRSRHAYSAVVPPSITSSLPVMYDDSSDAR